MAHKSSSVEPLFARFAALAAGLWRSRAQRPSLRRATPTSNSLDAMKPRAFQALVGEAFVNQGYSIVSSAEGVAMVLRKERQTFLVQCKHWKASKVGLEVVRDLSAAMKVNDAAGGFVVSSGRFSREASAFANTTNVKLIDAAILKGLLSKPKS